MPGTRRCQGPGDARPGRALRASPAGMDSVGSRSTASVLAELHWDDGYAIPVANAENKALEDEVSAGLRPGGERDAPPASGPEGSPVGPPERGAIGLAPWGPPAPCPSPPSPPGKPPSSAELPGETGSAVPAVRRGQRYPRGPGQAGAATARTCPRLASGVAPGQVWLSR